MTIMMFEQKYKLEHYLKMLVGEITILLIILQTESVACQEQLKSWRN